MTVKMFEVGKIVNTHGVRGEVRVVRITDFEERLAIGEKLYLVKNNESPKELTISGHRIHKQFDLLSFEGLDNINEVEGFKGAYLKIKKEQLTELQSGEYYYYEIIDCVMYTITGEKIGVIVSILSPGANDVWVVKAPNGKEHLIPFIKDVVKEINIDEKTVKIEPMEGLLD